VGRADVLDNNAGVSLIAAAEDTAPADFRRVVEIKERRQPAGAVLRDQPLELRGDRAQPGVDGDDAQVPRREAGVPRRLRDRGVGLARGVDRAAQEVVLGQPRHARCDDRGEVRERAARCAPWLR
jgi:hypothetical protein